MKLVFHLLSILTLFCYLLIFISYCAAHYYGLAGLVFISAISVIVFFLNSSKKNIYYSIVLIYIPILNIMVKDLFFLHQNNYSMPNIFLHSHTILLMYLLISGIFSNCRHVLFVGALAIAWIWFFYLYLP